MGFVSYLHARGIVEARHYIDTFTNECQSANTRLVSFTVVYTNHLTHVFTSCIYQ